MNDFNLFKIHVKQVKLINGRDKPVKLRDE